MKAILSFLALSMLIVSDNVNVTIEDDIYGEFFAPTCDLSLDLLPTREFKLDKLSFHYDIIDTREISSGTYEILGDTIILKRSNNTKRWKLLIKSSEVLIPIDFYKTTKKDLFLCWTNLDENGNKISNGGWKNNRKWGTWTFWNPDGSRRYQINFDTVTGLPIDTIK